MTTLKDIIEPVNFIFIKVCVAINEKFSPGDYVKLGEFSYSNKKWGTYEDSIVRYRSNFYRGEDTKVTLPALFLIKGVQLGGIKGVQVEYNALKKKTFVDTCERDLLEFNDNLMSTIDDVLSSGIFKKNDSIDDIIDFFVNNLIMLDQDYADSVIMGHEYVPYQSCLESIHDKVDEALKIHKAQDKELRSAFAKKGWETRKRREEARKKKAKIEAANIKRAATIAAKKAKAKKK